MSKPRRRWRMVAAFAAAYLLVLQSVASAFALGTGPTAAALDSFGNVICTHDGASELPAGDQHRKHMPACCMLGCAVASSALGAPPDLASIDAGLSFQAVVFLPFTPAHVTVERDRSPANPRAPPLA
ncbi:DUF2946 family protein [Mesorhizobium sp. A556]